MGLSKQGMSIRGGGWMSSQDYNDLTCYNQNLNNDFTEDKWLDQKTTAKWRQEQRKKIINSIDIRSCPFKLKNTRPDIYRQICIMIKRHPEYHTDRFDDIMDIEVRINANDKKNQEFWIKNRLGLNSFSLETCCKKTIDTPQQSQEYKLKRGAMRSTILPQIQNFKYNNPAECDICKKPFHIDDLQVDHKPPLTFKRLSEIFLEKIWKKPIPMTFRKSCELNDGARRPKDTRTDAFLEEDIEINDAWYKFHENNCILRSLCKPCHKGVNSLTISPPPFSL